MAKGGLLVGVLAGIGAISAGPAGAQDVGDYHRINLTLTEEYIIPRYETLVAATQNLVSAVADLCAAPSQAELAKGQEAFHAAMDA